jgi:uncharacterized membrane protein YhaH (DUF805 family)
MWLGMSWKNDFFAFDGRIGRAKWWLLNVASNVVGFALVFAITMLLPANPDEFPPATYFFALLVYASAFGAIFLAIGAKRWHDRDKSGWWALLAFVPVIGGIWTLVECGFLKGTAGPNRFGADPLK